MSKACPLPSDPDWKKLVDAIGEAEARTAFELNNFETPSIDEAVILLSKQNSLDPDEKFVNQGDELKLRRVVKQRAFLETLYYNIKVNDKQKATIKKLIDMNDKYREVLVDNIKKRDQGIIPKKSTSVSLLIGSSDYISRDPTEYNSFKFFGTFMHEMLEVLQVEALDKETDINKVLTREKFDKTLASYREVTPFVIDNMSDDIMYEMTKEIAEKVAYHHSRGFLILPEITVVGQTIDDQTVVGRVDIMMIDKDGKSNILDFKTKKVSHLADSPLDMGFADSNINRAYIDLATTTFKIAQKEGTILAFQNKPRTTYDAWAAQLQVYENILLQNGVPTGSQNSIIGLLYQTNDDKEFKTHVVSVFDKPNFYEYAAHAVVPGIQDGSWTKEKLETKEKHLNQIKDVIDDVLPVPGREKEKEIESEFIVEDIKLTEETNLLLKEKIKSIIAAQLQELYNNIARLDKAESEDDKILLGIYQKQKETLRNLEDIVNRPEGDLKENSYAVNFAIAIDAIDQGMEGLAELSSAAIENYKNDLNTSIEQNKKFSITPKVAKDITETFNKSRAFVDILELLKTIIADNNLDSTTNAAQTLYTIEKNNTIIEGNFREIALTIGIMIGKTPGEQNFSTINEQVKEIIVYELAEVKKKIKALEEEMEKEEENSSIDAVTRLRKAGVISRFKATKMRILAFASESFKGQLAERLGPRGNELIKEYTALKNLEKKYETQLTTGFAYTDEAIGNYIQSVTDPASQLYIGSESFFNPDHWFAGFGLDKAIASASNSDLMIAATTMFMKNAANRAVQNTMEDLIALEFDKARENVLKHHSVEELSEIISEVRTVTQKDENGNFKEKESLYFVKPFSEEYERTWREFNSKSITLNKEVNQLKRKRNEEIGKPGFEEADQKVNEKIKERELHNDEYIKWLMENSHTPFIDDYYEYQQMLPVEIREELQKKYYEIEIITMRKGKGNELLLDQEDFDRLGEIAVEIKKLKRDAKEKSEEYARYTEMFDELFEYDLNEAYFNRMKANAEAKYAENPKLMERWLKENTVDRPNEKWYEDLGKLYEKLEEIYGSNPIMKELIERRSKIKAPYNRDGRFNPKYLSEEDIEKLNEVENEIIEYLAELQSTPSGLSKDEKAEARKINKELQRITTTELSFRYTDEMESRYDSLIKKKNEYIKLETELKKAILTGDPQVINDAKAATEAAEIQFEIEEKEFKTWYDKYHYESYQTILNEENKDPKVNALPKKFNFERLPNPDVRDQYMDIGVPSGKYYVKRIRESTYNPNYLVSADGIPMPKNFTQNPDGTYSIQPGTESSKNINKKYLDIQRNPVVSEFYNNLMNMFFDLQKRTDGRKIGYMVPGYQGSRVSNLAAKGLKETIKSEFSNFADKNLMWGSNSQHDKINNVFGDLGARIRLRSNDQFDLNMQSRDVVSSLLKWTAEAHYNIAMQEVKPFVDTFIDYLRLLSEDIEKNINAKITTVKDPVTQEIRTTDMKNRLKELNKVIGVLEFERRKFIYGQLDSGVNRKIKKGANMVFAYTSFIRIGFDVANQVKNYMSGNVQAFIAAGHDSDHYTMKDLKWAKKKVYYGDDSFMSSFFKDYGKVSDLSETTLLYRMYNPLQKDYLKYLNEAMGGKKRRVMEKVVSPREFAYLLQDKGDTEIGVSVMYAVMNHYKYKVIENVDPTTGEKTYKMNPDGTYVVVPAHEAYIKNDKGMLVRRNDVDFSKNDEDRLRNIIYSEIRKAQGNYPAQDMTAFEESVLGKIMFFFKKYLVPQLLNRFGYMRTNWEAGDVALGYWRAIFDMNKYFGPLETAKHLLIGGFTDANKFGHGKQVGAFYTGKAAKASRDMYTMALMAILGSLAFSYVRRKDDNDEELGLLEGNAIRILWGIKGETLSMFPIGGGSQEYIKNFTTAIPMVREFNALNRMNSHALNYILAMTMGGGQEPDPAFDSEIYQNAWRNAFYNKKSGAYEKGDAKLSKDLMDLTGIKNFRNLLDPNYSIDQLKRNQ